MSVLAPRGSVEFDGTRVTFVPVDSLGVREAYELWLVESVYRSLWARKRFIISKENPEGFMTQGDWDEEHDATRRDVDTYVFSWGTEAWGKSYASLAGMKKLLTLMISQADPRQDADGFINRLHSKKVAKEERDRVVEYMLHLGEDPNSDGVEVGQPATSAQTK